MKKIHLTACTFVLLLIIYGCAPTIGKKEDKSVSASKEIVQKRIISENLKDYLKNSKARKTLVVVPPNTKLDTVIVDSLTKKISVNFTYDLSYLPFRPENVSQLYDEIRNTIGEDYKDYSVSIKTANVLIENLIPNFYRTGKNSYDKSRLPKNDASRPLPVVENISKPFKAVNGLYDKNILLWQSHGWYYNNDLDRWEWQRPRLFETVEDKVPMSFVLPYIIPMLENAGANVFVPRERDFQINEVITDNDKKLKDSKTPEYKETVKDKKLTWKTSEIPGFAYGNPPYAEGYNPFQHGSTRCINADSAESAQAIWTPNIPETGEYGVYISYTSVENSVSDAIYTVYHSGGKTEFRVNQKIGGGTWIYLGKFKFTKGYNPEFGKVTLSNKSSKADGKIVTADAVRFGGGMGLVSRNGFTSGRPKFLEGSRYWLQFAGMPDTLIFDLNKGKNDYNDDYQSRGEYGNYLKGAPFGPNRNRMVKGLGIPIDLSLAFHTDAGITRNDTSIGTLSIYSSEDASKKLQFPDGQSRLANRDFADIIQTQIVDDVRKEFDPAWSRRQLMDAKYSEARSPNFPGVLIELLSHQNFLDMKFELDPRFRFEVARAMYKGMLKYLADSYDYEYVVSPLAVDHFQAVVNQDGSATLRWKPVLDSLEKTAAPTSYIVYTRINDGDFDNGRLTETTEMQISDLNPGAIYSFKVSAVNKGGESFPSEVLSVCWNKNNRKPVLIINGFDRICGPATVENPQMMGFLDNEDAGVPDKYLIGYTGAQVDFKPDSPFRTNDAPGHGASNADYETQIIAGNSFDFPFVHGKAIKDCGYSFSSSSDEAVWDKQIDINSFKFVDLILGEEKETHWQKPVMDSLRGLQFKSFPEQLQNVIRNYCSSGGNLFVSGSYIGTDLFKNKTKDHPDVKFGKDVLKIIWAADHAAKTGIVYSSASSFMPKMYSFGFNTELNPSVYAVEAPDAIDPVKDESISILRYNENKFSAATAYKKDYGVVVFGFPFETIQSDKIRQDVMQSVFHFFGMEINQLAGQ